MNNVTFLIQVEGNDTLIGEADLFCYSLNKTYPEYKTIILCEKDTGINRNNTRTVVVPNTLYPKYKQKAENKYIIAIKRFTYLKEFFDMGNCLDGENLVVLTDPDTAFIERSKFLDSYNGITKNIMGVGPQYLVPQTAIKYFTAKSGGNDFTLYSPPFASHGSNIKAICNKWLDIWSYYINDPEMFSKSETFDHGNGYLIEMLPLMIVTKQLGLTPVQMFPSYYDELFHYFHPLKQHLKTEWCKRKISWKKSELKKIQFEQTVQNYNSGDIKFYRLFNNWVDNCNPGGIITR